MGRYAFFQVTGDVFEDDNRIVHDKTRGNCERHEGKVIQAVAAEVHDSEGGYERYGHGNARNEGAPKMPQECEHHQDHEYAGNDKGALDILQ